MAIINQATKELQVKIVYYGPAKSGKTTNLEQVHSNVQVPEPPRKGKLTSLATSSDRTLFFDFFPLEAVAIKGFKTKFALFTVPGQVIYNATRQIVLRGVDGIVFVADSQYDKMEENIETFKHLEENLKSLNLNLEDIPYVMQYNKRDVPDAAPVEYLDFLLNNREVQVPTFEASAQPVRGRLRDAQHDHAHASPQISQRRRAQVIAADDQAHGSVSNTQPGRPRSPQHGDERPAQKERGEHRLARREGRLPHSPVRQSGRDGCHHLRDAGLERLQRRAIHGALVNENNFTSMYQQGENFSTLMVNVDENSLLVIVFPTHLTVGSMKYYASPAVKLIAERIQLPPREKTPGSISATSTRRTSRRCFKRN